MASERERAEAALEARVQAELVRALHLQLPMVLGANAAISSLLLLWFWGRVSAPLLTGWWLATLGLCALRAELRRRYLRDAAGDPEAAPRWARRLTVSSLASGALWGASGLILFTRELPDLVLLSFVIGGMGAGAATTLPAHLSAFVAYLLPSFAPLAVRLLTSGEAAQLTMGLMTLVCVGCMGRIGVVSHRTLRQAQRLRFENEQLAAQIAQAEERLREANLGLEQRVAERTTELVRSQQACAEAARELAQARKMEAIGQLTGGVAHDFNNLLTVVIGNLELLRDLQRGGLESQMSEQALAAARRGAELTRNLLAFSRSQNLRPRTVDANDLVRRTVDGLLRRALGETVQIALRAARGVGSVFVDSTQLQTALLNLAINSRDAMPEGGLLTIETGRARRLHARGGEPGSGDAETELLCISVRDTGSGIPEAIRDRVFEPFFTTKGVGEGSGLGLSMVYGFISQSGGHVELLSPPEGGCEVRLYLPASQESPVRLDAASEGEPGRGHGETVLVVEDSADVRDLAVRMLGALGYRSLEADGPERALALLEGREPIDVLLSDVVMAGPLDGLKLAERAIALRPGLRVVLVSGYNEVAALARPPRGWRLLQKPYTRQVLATALREALERRDC